MQCFFCCKLLPKEEIYCQNDFEEEQSEDWNQFPTEKSNHCHSKYAGEVNRSNLLQISQYLNLPKNQIQGVKEAGTLSTFRFCKDCEEISGKLGELCGFLEITQMKINQYLNLLTDKILQKDGQINESSFQEIFHNKCLTKLAEINPNPVLQLTKCDIRPVQINTKVYQEEKFIQIRLKKKVYGIGHVDSDLPEIRKLERCNCGKLVRSINMRAHKIICENVKQESNTKLDNVYAKVMNKNGSKSYHYKRAPIKCDICGKMIAYKNISAHKKNVHGVMSFKAGALPGYLARKKLKRCEFCGKMVATRHFGVHQREFCGVKLNKKGNGREDEIVENGLVKICDYCGKGVLRTRFDEHERLWCEVKKRMMDLGEMEKLERSLKCKGCGERFEDGKGLRWHIKENYNCFENLNKE